MPSFDNLEVTVTATVDIEFEVFCTCGAGLCNSSSTRSSRNRSMAQVVVDVCDKCIEAHTQPLKDKIEELEQELANRSDDT